MRRSWQEVKNRACLQLQLRSWPGWHSGEGLGLLVGVGSGGTV